MSAREAVVKIVGNEMEPVDSSEHEEIRETSGRFQHEEQVGTLEYYAEVIVLGLERTCNYYSSHSYL